ncbi:ATP-binding protein [Streptomyces sp. NRRL S-1521]|uniref:ATP-binding protein n=1 Tax=Streptomyces sp. NRRL S-1521 TaxID=1609100 RepID=UPI0007C7B5AE
MVLIVSELLTHALCHADGACILDLTAHTDSIEVAVHDPSPQAPRMRTPDLNGGTGDFGWPMVNRLAHATSVTRQPSGGKTVRAALPRQNPPSVSCACPLVSTARGFSPARRAASRPLVPVSRRPGPGPEA